MKIILLTLICIIGLIAIYFKFKRDEKKKADKKREASETDCIDINDFPTYTRNRNGEIKNKL